MAKNAILTHYGDGGFPASAAFAAPIAANTAGNTTVKGSAGRLLKVLVAAAPTTTTGTTTIYDSAGPASGAALLVLPNNTAVGTIFSVDLPAVNGIVVGGNANCPGLTLGYA